MKKGSSIRPLIVTLLTKMGDECSDLESSLTAEESHELADDGGTIATLCNTYLGTPNTPGGGMNATSGFTEYRTTDTELHYDTSPRREQVRLSSFSSSLATAAAASQES